MVFESVFTAPAGRRAHPLHRAPLRTLCAATMVACALVLGGCGGGSGSSGNSTSSGSSTGSASAPVETFADSGSCSQPETFSWLRGNVRDNYLWADITPDRSPEGFTSLSSYFRALLFTGNERIPADRYSGYTSAASFSRFYGEGKTMGYGVAVAGQEVLGQPDAPLIVRYVEPASPAATAGVRRGQRVLSINGRSTPEVIAAGDFSGLSAVNEGDVLQLQVDDDGTLRTLKITAAVFDLTPARLGQVITSPAGQRLGYLLVQNMVSQTETALASAFTLFRDQRVDAVVLDLRYNGGGLVSVGARLASYVAGAAANGQLYARLQYNAARSAYNANYIFSNPAVWAGVRRVYVLTGSRTCSASEQVIHGLNGVGLEVVTIGGTTCGKPVGFSPQTYCDRTYSLVNFESVNAKGDGSYYNGLSPVCRVDEDPGQPLAQPSERLLAAALQHADGRGCPAYLASSQPRAAAARLGLKPAEPVEPELWQGMIAR